MAVIGSKVKAPPAGGGPESVPPESVLSGIWRRECLPLGVGLDATLWRLDRPPLAVTTCVIVRNANRDKGLELLSTRGNVRVLMAAALEIEGLVSRLVGLSQVLFTMF
jgi:hypothetical protein